MRIWIIHQHAIPPSKMGPTRHYDLAKKLIELNHEAVIIAGNYCHNNFHVFADDFNETNSLDHHEQVPFIYFSAPTYKKNSLKRLWNMMVFAYKIIRCQALTNLPKPDVIIGSSPSPLAAFAASRLARKLCVPFFYEIRDLWPETLVSLGKFKRYHPLIIAFQWLENYLVKNSVGIISVLPGAKDYLSLRNTPLKKIMWLPNFARLSAIPQPTALEMRSNVTVYYAGSFNVGNDTMTLLHAAQLLKHDSIHFKLIGDGPQKTLLQEFVHLHNLTNVEFVPKVAKDSIYATLQEADIFVGLVKKCALYRWGTSLNKISDYLALGRPVIFAVESHYDVIRDANAGMTVKPENPEALSQAIKALATMSPQERHQLGLNGRSYAAKHFNLDDLALQLLQFLKRSGVKS